VTSRIVPVLREHALRRSAPILAIISVSICAHLAYLPGLSGGFLFDDFTNLALLGYYGSVNNIESLWLYLLSGFAGPTGRPVAMASFLVDARDWPADPSPFKHTNILIHLGIGVALFGLIREMALSLGHPARAANWVAVLATALWLLHPLWVSTTLYVVQRMAQLAMLFVITGLWLYVRTRRVNLPRATAKTITLMVISIYPLGLLAVLSKENGALLPLLALMIEATVLAAQTKRQRLESTRAFKLWRFAILGVPIAILSYYLTSEAIGHFTAGPGTRDFTPVERMLTQGRILWDYVAHIALPRPWTGGIFHDQITVSTGLLTPWTTAAAWAAWVLVGGMAILWRTRYPAAAATVLFFLLAHLLESSILNLELYFEHRNYLPAALIGFPLALFWVSWDRPDGLTRVAVPLLILATLTSLTAVRADLWGSPFQQALKWSTVANESARAQHHLSAFWLATGHYREAQRLNDVAISIEPNGLAWRFEAVSITCQKGEPVHERIAEAVKAVNQRTAIGVVEREQVHRLFSYLHQRGCHGADDEQMLTLIDTLEQVDLEREQPALGRVLNRWRGDILLARGDPMRATEYYLLDVEVARNPGTMLGLAARIASHGYLSEALAFIDSVQSNEKPWESDGLNGGFGIGICGGPGISRGRLRAYANESKGIYVPSRPTQRHQILPPG
jgi:protein O-mannosyl-transferase